MNSAFQAFVTFRYQQKVQANKQGLSLYIQPRSELEYNLSLCLQKAGNRTLSYNQASDYLLVLLHDFMLVCSMKDREWVQMHIDSVSINRAKYSYKGG